MTKNGHTNRQVLNQIDLGSKRMVLSKPPLDVTGDLKIIVIAVNVVSIDNLEDQSARISFKKLDKTPCRAQHFPGFWTCLPPQM